MRTTTITIQTANGFEDITATLLDSGIYEFSKPVNEEDMQMCIEHVNICLNETSEDAEEMPHIWFDDMPMSVLSKEE